ncbi:cellulose binding domain-containing protein [Dactylosporangium aurantiacum]|nr:cellulose binding domain-containing protein [Dactylosporangium aurantiacum]MDG6103943.1 cellulose binding domain-containing protein [Dactylosporangium aurantiacum]
MGVLAAGTVWLATGTADAATSTVSVSINAGQSLATVGSGLVGANVAIWDGMLADAQTSTLLRNAAVSFVRYPGGSYGDIYHWQTNTAPGGYVAPNTDFDHYMSMVRTAGAQPIVIANYGSGTPQEAADWVRYANVTKGYGVKYWEIGNEVYGNGHYGADWETDNHADKSPRGYATNFLQYATAMKAVDPTIKIGVVLTTPGYWPDGIVGSGDSADWNDTVMSVVKNTADFGIFHYYPSSSGTSEAAQLAVPPTLASTVSQFRADMAKYATNNPGIFITETNSGAPPSDTQMQALWAADMYLTAAENGVANVDWWNVRNGAGATSTDVTGATDYGDGGIISSGSGAEPPAGTPFATYYGIQMVSHVAGPGDTMVRAASGDAKLTVHAAKRANGNLDVLLLNKDPNNTYQVNLSYSGYSPASSVTVDSFVNRGTGIVTTSQGTATSQTVPPYSLVTVHLHPGGSQSQSPSASTSASRSPSASPSSSRPPSSPPPATGACTATYRTVNAWPGGFQGEITVTAGAAPINGWTTTWTLPGGQSISQVWNGALSTSGSTVTVRNVTWNASLDARASTTFGFLANGTPTTPTIMCASP